MSACGVQTKRMKGPCVKWHGHMTAHWDDHKHRSANRINETSPRLRQFARIVHAALDDGVQLTYLEIARAMGHPNLHSVAKYGLGSRYTKLRQKIYAERGVMVQRLHRSPEQMVLRELKLKGEF